MSALSSALGGVPILEGMGIPDLNCPICSADIPLSGDEKKGDEVFCTYCGSPCRLTGTPGTDEELGVEEEEY